MDGFLVELPASAIRCALAVRARADIGLKVGAGVPCGECELIGGDVGGLVVHIAARLAALAHAGEVLVSGMVLGRTVELERVRG